MGGRTRAYPLSEVARHHVINDEVGGESVLVSYRPACRSGVAYRCRHAGRTLTFRVAALYRRNMRIRDLETQTFWQQAIGEARRGPLAPDQLGGAATGADPVGPLARRAPGHRRDAPSAARSVEARLVPAA